MVGVVFIFEIDVEVIVYLIVCGFDEHGFVEFVRWVYNCLCGYYLFVVVAVEEPDVLVGVCKECLLIVGCGDGEQFFVFGIFVFFVYICDVQVLEDDELVVFYEDGAEFMIVVGELFECKIEIVEWDVAVVEKGGYEMFMLKEIYEQVDVVVETIVDCIVRFDGVDFFELSDELLCGAKRIVIVVCGIFYYVGLIGCYVFEGWVRVLVEMDIVFEYCYCDLVVGFGDFVIGIM